MTTFWDIAPCNVLEVNGRFRGQEPASERLRLMNIVAMAEVQEIAQYFYFCS
jgi:hypothetical protein